MKYEPGELLVRFALKADGTHLTLAECNDILDSINVGTVHHSYKLVPGLTLVKLPENVTVEKAFMVLKSAPGILYAHPNYLVTRTSTFPNDPRFDELWGMHNTGQTGGTVDADIDAPQAWDIKTNASDIIFAVIDSGVDYTHPDLSANIWINDEEDHDPFGVIGPEDWDGMDDDGNGYVDDICGYDFCRRGQAPDPNPMDELGHGTHVSGIIGAVGNNGVGVTGVCWNVKIMALRFIDAEGRGNIGDAIDCISYAVLTGAKVLNNSWVCDDDLSPWLLQALLDAIQAAEEDGVLFIASAGNDDRDNDIQPRYPASFDLDNIIAVMATDHDDIKSEWPWWPPELQPAGSNWGAVSVDLASPGTYILSCVHGNDYESWSGTSMATPHVSGACALIWSQNPDLNHLEVKQIIMDSVDDISALDSLCVTGGRLNLDKAMALASEACFPICHPDYDEWVLVGRPECWCYPRQCHGDADGLKEGSAKKGYYYVHFDDLNVLLAGWNTKEPPFGPGIATVTGPNGEPGICADFAHDQEGSAKKGYWRVHFNDLNILIANWNILEPDLGPGIPPDCLDCQRGQQAKGGELSIEEIMKWLEEIWLDPEARKVIDEEAWLKFVESLMEGLQGQLNDSQQ